MTSKERAKLRGEANSLEVLFQVGKGGINDAFIKQASDALAKRELIKLKVLLESSPITPREAADEIAEKTQSEVVQVIGGCMIFYKYNPELHKKKTVKPVRKNTEEKPKNRFWYGKADNDKKYSKSGNGYGRNK